MRVNESVERENTVILRNELELIPASTEYFTKILLASTFSPTLQKQ